MITLNAPIQLPAPSIIGFTINEISDSPNDTIVRASVTVHFNSGIPKVRDLILWSGESYVSIKDWTQAQAEARVIELLSA